jgi:DNA-binding transcriptional MerR regulator
MNGYKISEAARATGFTESALRFYEQEGVVVPERTNTGYRNYGEDDLESLRFVARAKQLGLRLEEIAELLDLLRDDECRPVQTRMRHLITERITEAQEQVGDLIAFTALLEETASRLGGHTPDGACDDDCGCRTNSATSVSPGWETIPVVGSESMAVACSLEPGLVAGRIDDWKATVSQAKDRDELPNGIRLQFPRSIDVAAMARLAADEQTCCGFFTFTLGIDVDGVILEVTGPADAQPVIAAMFGAAA